MAERPAVEIERRMDAPPEELFAYFTDPVLHAAWCGTAVDLDPRPGGRYVVGFGTRGEIRGEYVELDPPRRLVLTWGWTNIGPPMDALTPGSTLVEITFVPDGEETVVRIRHTGIPPEVTSVVLWGWTTYLERLQTCAAGKVAGADPYATYGPPPHPA